MERESKFIEVAARLGLTETLDELQFLATNFRGVKLEGIAPLEKGFQIYDPETQRLIDENWKQILAEKPDNFAGPLASIKSYEVRNGILCFALKESRFDIYDWFRRYGPGVLDLGKNPLDEGGCYPVSMGCVTITAPDENCPTGEIITGIRSKKAGFGEEKASTLPAGYFNPDVDRMIVGDPAKEKSFISIRLTTIKEILEETGIEDYERFKYLGLVQDCVLSKQPLIAIRLNLAFTRAEIEGESLKDMGVEIDKFDFVPNTIEGARDYIETRSLTPHSAAKLILHFATI